ncbi:hypothetical protein E8E13_002758 [Curvularia kusanoi]|uniref:Uncharacterized protein n=1 Tax=Curvularia kusanoi TaxID=90978 RepID=A0A9P4TM21_CURKU|nr:hypothetical protein E8E13_002758 [Curvularia kusanoi]
MSFETRPAFVHYGTYDDHTRTHPAMKWFEEYTNVIDAKEFDKIKNDYMDPDHLLVRNTGQEDKGAAASVAAIQNEIYAPFAKWSHVPFQLVAYETDEGWEMIGMATFYWTLAVPGKQESGSKVKDAQGNEWDGATPGGFGFKYKKVDGGIRLSKTQIMVDRVTAAVEMLKRGMMKPEDLMK